MTFSVRYLRPSGVRLRRTQDQTWFGCSGRRRMYDPLFSQSRILLGCFAGTFSPSQSRCCADCINLSAPQNPLNALDVHHPAGVLIGPESLAIRVARPLVPGRLDIWAEGDCLRMDTDRTLKLFEVRRSAGSAWELVYRVRLPQGRWQLRGCQLPIHHKHAARAGFVKGITAPTYCSGTHYPWSLC